MIGKILSAIPVILVILILIVGGYYYFFIRGKQSSSSTTPFSQTTPTSGFPLTPYPTNENGYQIEPAVTATPIAKNCSGPESGDIAKVTINSKTTSPACLKVLARQKLTIKNNTQNTISVSLGQNQVSIPAGKEQTLSDIFGNFLAVGVHNLKVTSNSGAEIWLLGAEK
jgi:flagellar basal body-associated protein FliL